MVLQSWKGVLFLLLGIMIGARNLTHAQTRSATMSDPQTGTVVDIQPRQPLGKLKVRQKKGENLAEATVGMPLRRGYLLTLAAGASATVVCTDNKRHELQFGPQGCPCVTNNGLKRREGSSIPRPRGADTSAATYPVIISPRGTLLLTTRPAFRWTPVSKTIVDSSSSQTETTYRVSVYTDSMKLVWSKAAIKSTRMTYPADEPELAPGDYLVVVYTGNSSSEEEGAVGRGFNVLPKCATKSRTRRVVPCHAQTIREEEKRIHELQLPTDSSRLLIASLYASNELYAEATQELEAVLETTRTPAVLRGLGDLYASVGLNREAEKLYLEALNLSEMVTDIEALALTLHSLALTYERLGSLDRAREKYTEAISAYQKLGDDNTVKELTSQRSKIEKQKH